MFKRSSKFQIRNKNNAESHHLQVDLEHCSMHLFLHNMCRCVNGVIFSVHLTSINWIPNLDLGIVVELEGSG